MCQYDVYLILEQLGGRSDYKTIKETAFKKFPHTTLHLYIHNRLKKLKNAGYIEEINKEEHIWKIVKKYLK